MRLSGVPMVVAGPTPLSRPCSPLVSSLETLLTTPCPTLRQIPARCRRPVGDALTTLILTVASPGCSWEDLWKFFLFFRVVLRVPPRGGAGARRDVAGEVDRRLNLWLAGSLTLLWDEVLDLAERPRMRTRGQQAAPGTPSWIVSAVLSTKGP